MIIIKCDICGKELNQADKYERSTYDRLIDLCKECDEAYEKCDTEIAEKRKEIREKFEKDIKEETQRIFRKYNINIWKDENNKK